MEAVNKVGFLGEGWGALAAISSLEKYFGIEYMGKDDKIISLLSNKHTIINHLEDFNCAYIICSGYKPIINKKFLNKHKVINIHYSLLPKYRGMHSTAWAIINDEDKLGLSIHIMNEFIDDGPIIHQKEFTNDKKSSAPQYIDRFNKYIQQNLCDILILYFNEKITPKEQNKELASWVGIRSDKHNYIDFKQTNSQIKRLFRVLSEPYPLPKIKYKNQQYNVTRIEFKQSVIIADLSRILNIDNEGVWVKSKDGYCILKEIKDEKNEIIPLSLFRIGKYIND